MSALSLVADLAFALVRGCLIGINDFLIAKYLVIYHGCPWSLCAALAAIRTLIALSKDAKRSLKHAAIKLRSA